MACAAAGKSKTGRSWTVSRRGIASSRDSDDDDDGVVVVVGERREARRF